LRREGPIKEIARRLGLSRNTVRAAVRSCEPPRYVRATRQTAVDVVEPAIRELLQAEPRMPATVIAERIGWQRGITILKERVAELRPVYLPPDPAGRTTYRPGELAQWDLWFPAVDIPIGSQKTDRFPVIVGVLGYSRTIMGRMIPSRESHDLLGGHRACLVDLGRVPRKGVYDNEGAIGRWRGGKPTSPPPSRRSAAHWEWRDPVQARRSRGQGPRRASQPIPRDKASCRAEASPLWPTSTLSSRPGCRWPTTATTASSAAGHRSAWPRTSRP